MVAPRTRYAFGLPGGAPRGRLWAVFGTRSGSDLGVARYTQIKFDPSGARPKCMILTRTPLAPVPPPKRPSVTACR